MARIPNMGRNFAAVTPSDIADLSDGAADLFWVGTSGNVALRGEDGNDQTFIGVQGLLPCGSKRVLATGTTASDIIAIYGAG